MTAKKRKKTKPISVTAAGGIVYRQHDGHNEILLIYKNDCWDLPKGHQEENESIRTCAVREVAEETGIQPPTIEASLLTTAHTYQRCGDTYHKTTQWFKMKSSGSDQLHPQTEEGIEQARWIPIEKAKDMVGYDNLEKVIASFRTTF